MTPEEAARLLGVAPSAPEEEIRSAYRRLARENHPDRNPEDPAAAARFRAAADAHRVLTESPREPAPQAPSEGFEASPSEIFDKVFGRGRHRKVRGADLRYTLKLSLLQAVRGGRHEIQVPGKANCRRCGGTGAEPGSSPLLCPKCGGTGTVSRKRGFFDARETCPKCRGRGRLFPAPCTVCDGEGQESIERRIDLVVPAGVSDGTRLRLAGEGQAGEGGAEAGDLFVVLAVEPHPLFRRDGRDLVLDLPVSFTTAALGGSVRIPTLDGVVRLKVPPGSASGRTFRLEGKGVDGGDQRVVLSVEVPESLSEAAEAALRTYAELEVEQGDLPRQKAFRAALKALEE